MAKRRSSRSKPKPLRFDRKLVLNQWLLDQFDCTSFDQLAGDLKDPRMEGVDDDNISRFARNLTSRTFERETLPNDVLLQYDENILRHTERINQRRSEPIRWKYYQYLSLLFTEIYLDRYFGGPQRLLSELNRHVEKFNGGKHDQDVIETFVVGDLNKVAFWMATGSGKTLLMHVHLLQYRHYLAKYKKPKLDRILLITPNEGLSLQHEAEFQHSAINGRIFAEETRNLFSGQVDVQILDIHKLAEVKGVKTFAIDAFSGNNLVLVDEGHRGAAGVEWKDRRDRLCEDGFSFEYSATFGQAVRAASGAKAKLLEQEYAKCILFDYSYRYFYNDGFGKEYSILNLKDDSDDSIRRRYLTACLLAFYQQLRLFDDSRSQLRAFQLEKPLSVFVGGKVTANSVRTVGGRKVSDVLDVLLTLAEFISDSKESVRIIDRLLKGKAGLLDTSGREIFDQSFVYLRKQELTAQQIFDDFLVRYFNSSTRGRLHVELLKGADDEIGLRLGENDWFGVINVGDSSALHKLCEQADEFETSERDFGDSLFHNINSADSRINVLIGSRRFNEGWNSWRVSTMGLMNIGRGEGSQIIQLFGRGVRLKGYGTSLKRSRFVPNIERPPHLETLETLNIFGVRADYMEQFRKYLEEEGLPTGQGLEPIIMPVHENLPKNRALKVVDVPKGVDYKRQAPKPTLDPVSKYLRKHPVILNWYPRLQARRSAGVKVAAEKALLNPGTLTQQHLAFLDLDAVYFELLRFKNEKSWFNLNLPRQQVKELLEQEGWYRLYIPAADLEFTSFEQTRMWQEIAVCLLKKYVERYYKYEKAKWENDRLEYVDLDESRFPEEYRFNIDMATDDIIEEVQELASLIKDRKFDEIEAKEMANYFTAVGPIIFDCHVYHPLIHLKDSVLKVSPVKLVESEREFVMDLMKWHKANESNLGDTEMYLWRNQSRGRGVGFFQEGGFYPDFVLWLVDGDTQRVTFIDPHGLRYAEGRSDRKIQAFRQVQKKCAELGDPNIIMDCWIVTPTLHSKVEWFGDDGELMSKEEFEESHVLFQYDDKTTYIDKLMGLIRA